MVSEALSVALGRIPPPRAEMSVKALAELKRAVEDPNREQLREISQRLAQVETSLFSEGNGEEGGMLYASPPIAHKSVSSRSPQPRDFTPIPPQPVQDRKWGGGKCQRSCKQIRKSPKRGREQHAGCHRKQKQRKASHGTKRDQSRLVKGLARLGESL